MKQINECPECHKGIALVMGLREPPVHLYGCSHCGLVIRKARELTGYDDKIKVTTIYPDGMIGTEFEHDERKP